MSLFHSKAVDHRRFAAFGAVTLHVPVSFTALTALVGAAAVVGAPVTLRIDAFPYQKYGALKGRIVELHKAPMAAAATGAAKPAYRALVRLDKSEVLADGARRPLRVGMTLIAQVGLYRQSFLDALLDPLRAAKRVPDQNS